MSTTIRVIRERPYRLCPIHIDNLSDNSPCTDPDCEINSARVTFWRIPRARSYPKRRPPKKQPIDAMILPKDEARLIRELEATSPGLSDMLPSIDELEGTL